MKTKYIIKKNDLLAWLSLLISPIISLVIFIFMVENKRKKIFYISIFIALFSMNIVPLKSYDLVKHYYRFDLIKFNLITLEQYLKTQNDYFIGGVYWLLNIFNLKKEVIPFISNFISYYFILKLFNNIIKNSKAFFWIVFFISIDFRSITFGVRNVPAIVLIIYGSYLILNEYKMNGVVFFILAISVHFMTIPYIILLIPSLVINNKKIIKIIFYLSFLGMLVSPKIITQLINLLPLSPSLLKHIGFYTEGYWAFEYLEKVNFNNRVMNYLISFIKYWTIFFYFFFPIYRVKGINNKFKNFSYLSCSLLNLFYSLPLIQERYIAVPFFLGMLIFFKGFNYEKKSLLKKFTYRFLIISVIFYSFANIYEMRYSFLIGIKFLGLSPIITYFYNNVEYLNYLRK